MTEPAPDGIVFEGQAEVVLPRQVLAAYVLVFVVSCFLTALGAQVPVVGPVTQTTPLVVPAMLVLGSVELVRRAAWRSRRYVVLTRPGRAEVQERPFGVFAPGSAGASALEGARLIARPRGPSFVRPGGSLDFEGLEPSSWDALAHAVREAGGDVDDGFPPPVASRASRRRGFAPHVVVALTLGCALVGGLLDWRARREWAMSQRFSDLSTRVEIGMSSVTRGVEPVVLRAWTDHLTADPSLTQARRTELLMVGVDVFVASQSGGIADWTNELGVVIATAPPPGSVHMTQRWVSVRVVRDPDLVIPSAPRVELSADDDLLARLVLDAARTELTRLGIAFVVLERPGR